MIRLTPKDQTALARRFACQTPQRMKWQMETIGIHQCTGCFHRCGMTGDGYFEIPIVQVELFASLTELESSAKTAADPDAGGV